MVWANADPHGVVAQTNSNANHSQVAVKNPVYERCTCWLSHRRLSGWTDLCGTV